MGSKRKKVGRWLAGAGIAAASVGAILVATAGSAGASIVGDDSPGQTGYATTGGQFRYVHGSVYLRAPGQYSSYLSGVGGSVSLWATDGSVVQLGISNSTSPPGSVYSPAVAPFDSSHNQITSGINAFWCPAGGSCAPASQGGGFPGGENVQLGMYYNRNTGNVDMNEWDAAGDLFKAWFHVGTGLSYTKAEVTSDFGYTPWDQKGYLGAPKAETKLLRWSNAGVTNYNGKRHTMLGWFTTQSLTLTGQGSVIEAKPGALNAAGSAFSTYLEPAGS